MWKESPVSELCTLCHSVFICCVTDMWSPLPGLNHCERKVSRCAGLKNVTLEDLLVLMHSLPGEKVSEEAVQTLALSCPTHRHVAQLLHLWKSQNAGRDLAKALSHSVRQLRSQNAPKTLLRAIKRISRVINASALRPYEKIFTGALRDASCFKPKPYNDWSPAWGSHQGHEDKTYLTELYRILGTELGGIGLGFGSFRSTTWWEMREENIFCPDFFLPFLLMDCFYWSWKKKECRLWMYRKKRSTIMFYLIVILCVQVCVLTKICFRCFYLSLCVWKYWTFEDTFMSFRCKMSFLNFFIFFLFVPCVFTKIVCITGFKSAVVWI